MIIDLSDRVVLVTGGGRGVGLGITAAFLHEGAQVVICGRTVPEPVEVDGKVAHFIQADLRNAEEAFALVDAVVEKYGRIDVAVNNAGGSPPADAAEASPRFSQRIVELNLLAPLWVAQRANHHMQRAGEGLIINICSVSGQRPSPGTAAYGAAKAGLLNLTKSLAMEWAPRVRVNAVVAGLVFTEQADLHYGGSEAIAEIEKTVPMGRMASPMDIASACLYLASPLAEYVTGADLSVHGGGEPPPFLAAADPTS